MSGRDTFKRKKITRNTKEMSHQLDETKTFLWNILIVKGRVNGREKTYYTYLKERKLLISEVKFSGNKLCIKCCYCFLNINQKGEQSLLSGKMS